MRQQTPAFCRSQIQYPVSSRGGGNSNKCARPYAWLRSGYLASRLGRDRACAGSYVTCRLGKDGAHEWMPRHGDPLSRCWRAVRIDVIVRTDLFAINASTLNPLFDCPCIRPRAFREAELIFADLHQGHIITSSLLIAT